MKLLITMTFLTALTATTIANAQTWPSGGSLTKTTTAGKVTVNGHIVYFNAYTNWVYSDSNGTHSFPDVETASITNIDGANPAAAWDVLPPQSASEQVFDTTDSYFYTLNANGSTGQITINSSGSIYPKFQVLSVTYAPPGPASYVDYKSSSAVGVSTTTSQSFSSNTSLSVGANVLGSSVNLGADYTHTNNSSTTEGTTKTTTYDIETQNIVTPVNTGNFIDHNYDVIDIWLNPEADFVFSASTTGIWDTVNRIPDTVNGYDTYLPLVNGLCQMDHISVLAGYLNGNIPWPTDDTLQRLARAWDLSMPTPGLTIADYAAVLALDPWAQQIDPATGAQLPLATNSQVFAQTMNQPATGGASNNRYTYITNLSYTPMDQILTGSFENQTTSSTTNQTTNSLSVSYGKKSSLGFCNISTNSKWTWTNSASNTNNSSGTNTATYQIVNPNSADPLPAASSVSIYQDNIYGTFMFAFPGGGF